LHNAVIALIFYQFLINHKKLTKNNKYLKNTNVNFEVYDMEEDLEKFK
jgi:hypothetical protein